MEAGPRCGGVMGETGITGDSPQPGDDAPTTQIPAFGEADAGDAAPAEAALADTPPQNPPPQDAVPAGTVSQGTVPEDAEPEGAKPDNTVPGAAAPPAGPRQPVEVLYQAYYHPLVRLAALLTADLLTAEEIAADCLAAALAGLADRGRASDRLQFRLRRQVLIRAREATKGTPPPAAGHADRAEHVSGPAGRWQDSQVVRVLGSLPACQREAVVLRHYLGLDDREIAALMGASLRAVRRTLVAASDPAIWASLSGDR